MFMVKFMQENYYYLIFGENKTKKSVYSWLLNRFNFLPTIAPHSKIDWDYFMFLFDDNLCILWDAIPLFLRQE